MAAKKQVRETERLSLRCTKSEKRMIERVAREEGLSLTQCTIKLYRDARKKQDRDKNTASAVCRMQTLVNYMRDHHIENDYIVEECDRIWDELS